MSSMAVVLSSEESSYFSSNLRRSYSQPNFVANKHSGCQSSQVISRNSELFSHTTKSSVTSSSSVPSSPRVLKKEKEVSSLSCPGLPASTLQLQSDCEDALRIVGSTQSEEPQIILPQYDDVGYFSHIEDLEPPPSPQTSDSCAPSSNELGTSTNTSRPGSPELLERAEDDISVRVQPSRHVDYLSHNWREEDIWSSWKLVVSRRGDYSNAARLENASWRTWMKSKNKLRTVSPETLNWLKDCDVTWLYGPLQTGSASFTTGQAESSYNSFSASNVIKKPILKKRSMSELMLQRSLSTSSLLKQAAAAVQAQQSEAGLNPKRPGFERAVTDSFTFPSSSSGGCASRDNSLTITSSTTSGLVSPSGERKHIHFNEQVEQCIAVDVRGDDDDEEEADSPTFDYDSDSDDGAIMMKRTVTKKKRPILKRARSNTSNGESKTIAMLPSTTLKYREDSPELLETAMKHSTGVYRSPGVSPSSSQETLRPSKPSGKLFISGDDDENDDEGEDSSVQRNQDDDLDASVSWRSSTPSGEGSFGLHRSLSSSSLGAEPAGLRRTPSGMLMPYEEGDSASTHDGIIGRVIDTVNTARDIAHVIWNVGWRR
ncbi:hypothetical protein VTK73DRAFT_6212 [Phialemonium thermophilum]|uniref:Nitrogen regulatory protein areA GATA-like domain-containing protein n=1 Tax=Phialemonium thermophilum TaxID=223376 RepID=A0ABR3XX15_9PEZI